MAAAKDISEHSKVIGEDCDNQWIIKRRAKLLAMQTGIGIIILLIPLCAYIIPVNVITISVHEQKKHVQRLKHQVSVELSDVEEQLHALQTKRRTCEKMLQDLKNRSCISEEEEVTFVLEEQRLVKELNPLIKTIIDVKQERDKLVDKLQWVKILKYELHKGNFLNIGNIMSMNTGLA